VEEIMRNIFDVTHDDIGNMTATASDHITSTVSPEMCRRIDDLRQRSEECKKKYGTSGIMSLLTVFLFFISIGEVIRILAKAMKTSFTEVYENDAVSVYLSALFLGLFFICGGILLFKAMAARKNGAFIKLRAQQTDLIRDINNSMFIPESAYSADLMYSMFVVRNGKKQSAQKKENVFFDLPVYIYTDNSCLHIFDMMNIYSFTLDSIVRYEDVEQNVELLYWNKPESCGSETYKNSVKTTVRGTYSVKGFLSLRLQDSEYEILFPSYDSENIKALLINKKAKERNSI